jgi:ATP-dependent DNA helicase RecQ
MLGHVREKLPYVPIMALTATADLATREDIALQLQLRQPYVHVASFDRPNIQYTVASKYKPLDQIVEFIKQREGSGIIYCNSRKKVDEIAERLNQRGYRCGAYHAGLSPEQRAQAQRDFQVDNLELMVATVAFGMGINKSNVRFVIHHDIPRSIEAYYQETGRAGRDGLPAEALMLFAERDAARIQAWIETSEGGRTEVELEKFAAMQKFAEAQTCRRQILLNYFAQYSATQCGNCDVCLDPPKHFDALEVSQKVLSCVYRMRQQGTLKQIVDVLKGRKPARVVEFGFDKLSTFGIGKEKPDEYWFNIINQLVHQGFLRIDINRYGALSLTDAAKEVLRGTVNLQMAVPRLTVVSTSKSSIVNKHYDKALFAKLKHLRKRLADEQDIPPFVVFSDASLIDMASQMPQSPFDFLQISGVGQVKLEKYGSDFIALITAHVEG